MHLILAVIFLSTAAFAQEFIPIGGGSGRGGQPRISQEFGESFTPTAIDPNDPSFQPANILGNRPNPIPLFPKSQQAGTPHESPVDFTFIHQHSYKEPFRNDQFIGILHNPIGAARPNIPRTLGRENIFIDPRTIPNSAILQAEAEKRNKNMMFYGLAPPVQKLHSADEFAPSSMSFEKPWDQWYDRFTEAPVLPRRQSSLTQTKRPTIVDIPFYAADRGKRETEITTETSTGATSETTTTVPATTTILSDAIGSSTAVAALETTTSAAAAVIGTTTGFEAELTTSTTTTTPAPATESTTATVATTTVATASNTTSSSTVSSTTSTPTAKPLNQFTSGVAKVATSLGVISLQTSTEQSPLNVTSNTPVPSTGPVIPFRVRNRQPQNSTNRVSVAQKFRSHRTKVPLRSTLIVHNTTHAPTTKHTVARLKVESAVGTAKNSSRAATTKLPIRNTTVQRRPISKTRVSLRRLFNNTTTIGSKTTTATTPAATTAATTTATSTVDTTATTPATVTTTTRTLNRTSATTASRTKAPFRIFSKRPMAAAKLPARTPIQEESKPAAIESNNIGTLRTEVNRLLSTVIQLQSTVISQQQRIALLENQLRLRRSTGKKPASNRKTSRFIAANGRTVERTTVDVRKERSAKLKGGLSQVNLRQKSSLA